MKLRTKWVILAVTAVLLTCALAVMVHVFLPPPLPPDGAEQLRNAAANGDLKRVAAELAAGAPIDGRGKHGATPLCVAAREAQVDVVEYLIGRGADPNDGCLVYAMGRRQLETARFLLDKGARPSASALVAAVYNGEVGCVELLVSRGADVDELGKIGGHAMTALHAAARRGHTDLASYLIAAGATVDSRDHFGYTPLHYASIAGQKGVVLLLISEGADVNARTQDGLSPLDYAIKRGHDEIAKILQGSNRVSPPTRRSE